MKRFAIASISLVVLCTLALVTLLFTPGCSKKSEPKEIKIGAILILTGSDAKAGQSAKQGIDMAVKEVNGKGGINKKKVRIIFEDDQGEPEKAVTAVRKLINVDKVSAIIGPMWSSSVLAVSPIVEKEHVVILSPTASSPKITQAGDFVFRNTYSDILEGAKAAQYAYNNLKYKSAALIFINNDYGLGLKDAFKEKFLKLGGQIIDEESYDPKSTDFRTQLVKINKLNPEVIYLVGYSEMGKVLVQAKELGISIPFMSCIMFGIGDVIAVAGEAAEGVTYTYPSYDPEHRDKVTQEFGKQYKEKYGTLPDPEAAFAYDATNILFFAMTKGGLDSNSIKNALYQIKDYNGVTGLTGFNADGDVIKPIGFKKIVNGKPVWVVFTF